MVLQKLTKSYKSELRHLFQCCILIPRQCPRKIPFQLAFPTGRDGATFRDKGTEISTLSRDKGTTGQAQKLATGRDGTGF